jgi:hypothetical protein
VLSLQAVLTRMRSWYSAHAPAAVPAVCSALQVTYYFLRCIFEHVHLTKGGAAGQVMRALADHWQLAATNTCLALTSLCVPGVIAYLAEERVQVCLQGT